MGLFSTFFSIVNTGAKVVDQGLSTVNHALNESSRFLEKESMLLNTFKDLKVSIRKEETYLELMVRRLELYHKQLDLVKKIPIAKWTEYGLVNQQLLQKYNIKQFNDVKQLRLVFLDASISYSPGQFSCPDSPSSSLNAEVQEIFFELVTERERLLKSYARQLHRYQNDLPWLRVVFEQTGGSYLIDEVFPETYHNRSDVAQISLYQ